ncbi:SDR family NAD(P)-dependent oxidoreductase [Rathayibacter sp. VKM Ac-2803]|uniref:SDR family NAD(P)-dependent oxidoreductase n=1 Tax=Rathayibacter sp. VKM Ac-2803 TaxID=2609256 RepID=UPI001357AE57|nr:SDR family NAD(P)-dependent oxidoreductase [Rathayibacter sp. VKM Ac-2803]MWV48657.1 SDR family NAD(P)-dependent oxidoreductase [Rathayibacter sp. VKM Ac-2803]
MTSAPLIVITGATNGLGRIAAGDLARQGARLAITARSRSKADETRAEILARSPRAEIDVFLADFTRVADTRRVAAEIGARYDRIDVLVNNAGLHAFEPRITPDGLPEMIAVNYLTPFILTNALLPHLHRAPAGRIVTVASEASRRHGTLTLPGDLTDTTAFTARGSSEPYGKSKLLDIMFSLELARRLAGTSVTANCLDPGFNTTGLGRELGVAARLERILTALHIGDPRRGADLITALATDAEYLRRTGLYVTARGRREIRPVSPGDDAARRAQLWTATEELIATLA